MLHGGNDPGSTPATEYYSGVIQQSLFHFKLFFLKQNKLNCISRNIENPVPVQIRRISRQTSTNAKSPRDYRRPLLLKRGRVYYSSTSSI